MNRNRKKAAAATLAAGMAVVLGAGTVMAAASTGDNGLQKEETVYVNTTAGGEVTDVTVSDWLKNSGDSSNSEVKDASDLQDIKNVKGDETFTQNGNDLTWSTDGKDIYYQGKTEKNLPVSVGIKYYMDGTEVSPEALAGKTGHLKMEVTYTNTSKTTKTVNGKKTDIYSPFVMVTGMILSTDNFSNVTVDNGKVISDGSRNVVVGFGMPGMKESLDMSSDIADEVNIPEGFTVEADVTDCEMNSTFTVAFLFFLLMSHLSLITPYEHYSYQRFPEVWHLPHYCPAWKEVTCQYCSNSSDCYFHELPGKALPGK